MDERILPRGEFLRLLELKSATLDQRVHKGELPFAFGLSRPAHIGEYSVHDAISVLAGSMVSGCAKIELKTAADLVRDNWEDFLKGVAIVERQMNAGDETWGGGNHEIWFAVATVFGDDGKVDKVRGAIGTQQEEAVNALWNWNTGPHGLLYMLPLKLVLRMLRNNAKAAKIKLPALLIPAAPGTPEYEAWLTWVREYRRRADLKQKAKAKKAMAMA
jgi:hypothetical protein